MKLIMSIISHVGQLNAIICTWENCIQVGDRWMYKRQDYDKNRQKTHDKYAEKGLSMFLQQNIEYFNGVKCKE